MQRILLFIIDSLNFSRLRDNGKSLMPFLYRLSREGISCENMFSQAPYTEAAVMNIYCGQSVLENGGYLKRFKCAKKTIFEAMKENGYTTYYNSFQSVLINNYLLYKHCFLTFFHYKLIFSSVCYLIFYNY